MATDTLLRTGLLVRHNLILRLRDPGQLISYVAIPMVLMLVLKPLYMEALDSGTVQAVTGPLVMFSVFALAVVGNSIMVEREWRTWDRLRSTRAGRAELLLGKMVPGFVVLLVQQCVLMAYGSLVLGLDLPGSVIGWVALAVAVWGLALLSMGAFLATVARSRGDLGMVTDLGAISISALGGALVPVDLMPGWAQHVAPFSPGYWAMSLLRAALSGDGAGMVRPVLVCLAITLVFGVLAAYRLSRGWGRSHLL
ncbi:ABC transporter permease [Streptomyces sp. NBC_00846]|uniref:ABC transporter permease n=1 Tax=Streptomyces sp. NBC_00846 TaxID=2975849 RepID=UPI00386621E2|nr:ABC transporter permease [Streptomyces sp. NBC_00846]